MERQLRTLRSEKEAFSRQLADERRTLDALQLKLQHLESGTNNFTTTTTTTTTAAVPIASMLARQEDVLRFISFETRNRFRSEALDCNQS